jgi:hypothetical protein
MLPAAPAPGDRSSGSRVSLRCSSASSTGVNISQLGKPSLRRYQASYGLEPTLSDQDLLLSVQHHFDNCEVRHPACALMLPWFDTAVVTS